MMILAKNCLGAMGCNAGQDELLPVAPHGSCGELKNVPYRFPPFAGSQMEGGWYDAGLYSILLWHGMAWPWGLPSRVCRLSQRVKAYNGCYCRCPHHPLRASPLGALADYINPPLVMVTRKVPDVRFYKETGDINKIPWSGLFGTGGYIAPEILRQEAFGKPADLWYVSGGCSISLPGMGWCSRVVFLLAGIKNSHVRGCRESIALGLWTY